MFVALLVQLSFSWCNSSLLQEGQTCCNNEVCSGECIRGYKCVEMTAINFCGPVYPYIISIAIFITPIIIFWILSCVTKTEITTATWIYSLLINASATAIIHGAVCASNLQAKFSVVFIAVGAFIYIYAYIFSRCSVCGGGPECCSTNIDELYKQSQMVKYQDYEDAKAACPCCLCCCETLSCCACCKPKKYDPITEENLDTTCNYCCNSKADTLQFLKFSRAPLVTPEDLKTIDEENFVIPPTPKSRGIAYYNDKNGYHVVNSVTEDINYGSWQENGTRVPITADKVFYTCKPHYRYMENMREEIEKANLIAKEKAKDSVYSTTSYDIFETNGMTMSAVAATNSCPVQTFKSCGYKTFYEILFLIGYRPISDFFYFYGGQVINVTSNKVISNDQNELRAKQNERDNAGVFGNQTQPALHSELV